MEEKRTPDKKEPTNDRQPRSLFEVLKEPKQPGEEGLPKADDADELPFDLPRD